MSRIKDEHDHYHDILPQRIRETMDKQHLSYKELEEKSGINAKQLSRYGLGNTEPTASILAKLAKALNVSVDYLLGLSDVSFVNNNDETLNLFTVGDVVTVIDALRFQIGKCDFHNEDTYVEIRILDKKVVEYYSKKERILEMTYKPNATAEDERFNNEFRVSELKRLQREMFDTALESFAWGREE